MADHGYQESVNDVISRLEVAEEYDGFIFAAQAGDQVTTTKGVNPDGRKPSVEQLLGFQLFSIAEELEMHPAVIAHSAVQWAISQSESGDPTVRRDHDGRA